MTCAFASCVEATSCGMAGGCVERRFGRAPTREVQHELRQDARALAGTKPARTNSDPALIKRTRKVRLR